METPVDVEENIEIEIAEEPLIEEDKTKEFDINVVDREMTLDPPIISVEVGDQVLLNIITDEDLMFHIHEYDHEITLVNDEAQVLSFPAMFPGRFEIEIHPVEHEAGEEEEEEHDHDEEETILIGFLEVMPRA